MKIDDRLHQESFILIRELLKALRFFREDAVFCEDLTFQQFTILDYVKSSDGLGMSDLKERLLVEKSTLTRLINPLIKKGLVEKKKSTEDHRAYRIFVTSEGQSIHESIWDCFGETVGKMIANIPSEEREEVYKNLSTFVRSLFKCCDKDSCCV